MRSAQAFGGGWQLARRPRNLLLRIPGLTVALTFVAALFVVSAVSGHNAGNEAALALRAAADVNSNISSFSYVPGSPGVAISSRQYRRGAPGLINLTVYGMPPAPGDASATILVDLSNETGQTASFATGGPLVAVTITHDGQPFRQITLSQPATLSLDPNGVVKMQTPLPLSGKGTYGLSAALVGIGTNPAFTLGSAAAVRPGAP